MRDGDGVDQVVTGGTVVLSLLEERPLQLLSPQSLTLDQDDPPDQIEGREKRDK